MFEKRLKHVGNDVDLYEMAKRCGEMTKLFDKWLKNVESVWEMANIFGKWLRYMVHGLNI